MRTQCPNPACRLLFEVSAERAGKNGPCPACGQVITFRSLEILLRVACERERRVKAGMARGGPAAAEGAPAPLGVLLEDLRSLWNVGSIFRTADGAGFQQLYLCGITGCPPRKEIAKTSLGAEEHVAWSYHAGALEVLPDLKRAGVQIVGLEKTETSEPLEAALARNAFHAPVCLVVGNEVSGISAETLHVCERVCHLPMRGVKGSLNVAVAFGIAAYQLAGTVQQ